MIYNLDLNHDEIVTAFETLGCIVIDNAKTKRYEPGQLDLWVGLPNPYGGLAVWVWVEVKTSTGALRAEQKKTIADCKEAGLPVEVIRSTADIEAMYHKYLGLMRDV